MDITSHVHIPLEFLLSILLVLLLFSAFFSSSETSMMSLNRYRLKHLSKTSNTAKKISRLLKKPDRLLATILIGNNFVNISASAVATLIGIQLFGDIGVVISTITLTLIVLLFAEIMPKTLAAIKPEQVAYVTVNPLSWIQWLLFPLSWLAGGLSSILLRWFGFQTSHSNTQALNLEELRTLISESKAFIPTRHQQMLASLLDLGDLSVDDIMIPRTEIIGIDLNDSVNEIKNQLQSIQHTLLPIYKNDLENVLGIVHVRDIAHKLVNDNFNQQTIQTAIQKPYFVPEGTSLHTQLIYFQRHKLRLALVVDEYGDILGLVTLEDILEEIVGEFTTDVTHISQLIHAQPDGSYIIDGSINLRALNHTLNWHLPTTRAKTLNGIVTEFLEAIPEINTCLMIDNYVIEVLQIQDNMIKTARVRRYVHNQNQ